MKTANVYIDLDGNSISLLGLDAQERRLIARLRRHAQADSDWCQFDDFWIKAVAEFYDRRGLSRKASSSTVPYRVGQDLSTRLGLAAGLIRPPDYRDELEELIRERFPTRRAFSKATGISEDLLSHVLAGRKDLSLATLTRALEQIGYRLTITPTSVRKRTG